MKYIMLFEQWLVDKSQPLILEGGASGHMLHPFDDAGLTFGDFKTMIDAGLRGELNFEEEPTEKTDGQNLWATMKDGKVMFARNKGESINPMSLSDIKNKFKDHSSQSVRNTFQFAADDLSKLLIKLPKGKQEEFFNNGKNFINMELIYSLNPNIINYDAGDLIQFHNITKTDGVGNIIGVDRKPAAEIESILKKLESNIGKTFTLTPPKFIKLKKDIDFSKNKDKFLNKLNKLQKEYNLKDSDPLSKYHEGWWTDFINSKYPNLSDDVKYGLMLRWAFGDKKALNFRSLAKQIGADEAKKVKDFDKKDVKSKQKENMRPFEDLFLSLGSVILKNASNLVAANPEKETQRLRDYLRKESDKILKTESPNVVKKVKAELERLQRIGGIESIFPTEGIVFKYNGKLYKLTGTFAAINQLLNTIKYGRA